VSFEIFIFHVLKKIVLNTIFVSIPEELFLVLFTLILTGEYSYWIEDECKKLFYSWDYQRILVPSIFSALISNTLRYLNVNSYIVTIATLFSLYFLIVFTNDIFNDASIWKWLWKAFSSLFIGFFIIFITEILYIPFVISATSLTIGKINNNILLNFLISLPSRLVQIIVIIYLILKHRVFVKSDIFTYIYKRRFLTIQALLVTIFNFSLILFVHKMLVYYKLLNNFPDVLKIILIVIICIFPIVTTFLLIITPYYIENKQSIFENKVAMKLYELDNEILSYRYQNKQNDVNWMLNKVSLDIKKIAEKLSNKHI